MTYDLLSDYVNNCLCAGIAAGTTIHDNHVWTFYMHCLHNQA